MLKTQRQIVEQQIVLQEFIEQELKERTEQLRSGDWNECSQGERLRRSLRVKIAVLERAVQQVEVKNHQRLLRYLDWQLQDCRSILESLRIKSETETLENVPAKQAVPARRKARKTRQFSQQEINDVLNPPPKPFSRRLMGWLRKCWQGLKYSFYTYSPDIEDDEVIQFMEEHIQKAESRLRQSGDWERLPESEKALCLIEEKIESCDFTIEIAMLKRRQHLLRYALRAKECYTIYLDAMRLEATPL